MLVRHTVLVPAATKQNLRQSPYLISRVARWPRCPTSGASAFAAEGGPPGVACWLRAVSEPVSASVAARTSTVPDQIDPPSRVRCRSIMLLLLAPIGTCPET